MASKLYSKLSKNFDYNELKKVLSTNKQLIKINANIKQKSMIGRNENSYQKICGLESLVMNIQKETNYQKK